MDDDSGFLDISIFLIYRTKVIEALLYNIYD